MGTLSQVFSSESSFPVITSISHQNMNESGKLNYCDKQSLLHSRDCSIVVAFLDFHWQGQCLMRTHTF